MREAAGATAMIVRMGLFRRRSGLAHDEFVDLWRNGHGPVARSALTEMQEYVQNAVTDRVQRSIDYDRLPIEVDGISQLNFADLGALRRSTRGSALQALADDEARFMEDLVVVTALRNTILPPPPAGAGAVKRMSLLRRRSNVGPEAFQREWFETHAALVRRIPGILGYRQNLVLGTERNRFDVADDASDVGIDGIVELWFENTDAIEAGFRSPPGLTTMAHAREFLGQISTYLVEPYDVP